MKSLNTLERPFFHLFELNGLRFLFDVPTSVSLQLDDIAYKFIEEMKKNSFENTKKKMCANYSQSLIKSVVTEFEKLKRYGLFSDFILPKKRLSFKQISLYRPHHFVMMVTQKCNLRCRYCYAKGGNYGGDEILMTQNTAFKAVDFLVDNSSKRECGITFFGGEPLINFNIIRETVHYAKRRATEKGKKFRFNITTNGTLLTDEIIRFLIKEKFNLLLSFDGPKEIHDYSRVYPNGQGSYEIINKNITKLLNYTGFRFSVRATVTRNCTSLRHLSQFFTQKKLSKVYIHPISPRRSDKNSDYLNLGHDDYKILLKEYEQLALDIIKKYKDRKPIVFNPFKKYLDLLKNNTKRFFSCGVCKGMLAINVDGNIFPCHRFVGIDNFIIGDLDHWLDAKKILGIFQKFNKAREVCNSCWAVFLCAKGCLYDWTNGNGSFIEKEDANCMITKKIIELSIFIYSALADKNSGKILDDTFEEGGKR